MGILEKGERVKGAEEIPETAITFPNWVSDSKAADLPFLRNVKRSSSERKNIMYVRIMGLYEDNNNTKETSEGKLKTFIFLIHNLLKTVYSK